MSSPAGVKRRYIVARVGEIPPGARRIIALEGRSIGVFNVHGRYVAVRNVCPHELAPVCLGHLGGTTLPSAPGEWNWGREVRSWPAPGMAGSSICSPAPA